MVGLYSYGPDPLESVALREQGAEAVPATTGQVLGAAFGEGMAANIFPRVVRSLDRLSAETGITGVDALGTPIFGGAPEPLIEPDVVNAEFGIPGHLKFDKPTSRLVAKDLHDHKFEALRRQEIIERREGGILTGAAAQFSANIVAGILDPINLAVGFIPVAGEARIAGMLAQASGALGRAGVRAGIGGAQGALGMAALQPLEFLLSRQEQEDYTMGDALRSIALGTVMGGGMHAGIGAGLDRYTGRYRNPVARGLDDLDPNVREGLLQGSLGQVIEGRPVDVNPALDLVPLRRGLAPFIDDPLALHQRGELSSARAAEVRDAVTAASPEEVARLRAAGVPVDPEMWRVITDNLAKAEASREGGLAVVTDQLQYLPASGELATASAREAAAVIRRAIQLESERGGDPAALLNQAIADAAVPAAIAEQARGLLVPSITEDAVRQLTAVMPDSPNPPLATLAEQHGAPVGGTTADTAAVIVQRIGPDAAVAEAERLAAEHAALMGGAGERGGAAAEPGAGVPGVAGREPTIGGARADDARLPVGGRGVGIEPSGPIIETAPAAVAGSESRPASERAPAAGEPGGPRPSDTLAEITAQAEELERLQHPPRPGEPPRPESQAAADLVAEAESHASAVERAAYCITR